jgi:hypothetical protein
VLHVGLDANVAEKFNDDNQANDGNERDDDDQRDAGLSQAQNAQVCRCLLTCSCRVNRA